nr:EOG090X018J [Eurycercus lamellatus]
MDMLNKLKSTVSTTVSQLSGVLPGNPVTREYEVGKLIGSAGPELLWRIYSGFKKSTRQEAAIFVLEKKLLDKYSKKDKELIIDLLKKGVAQLTRLRHPQVLTVQHPVEESRESLAFATEPVFASLANILGNHENISPVPQQLKEYKLFEVEIKYGLQQLTEGLIFLHNDVKLLHGNLCPESVVVNQQGAFKIFGFDFCTTNTNQESGNKTWPVREPDPELPQPAQSNLDFLAPELGRNPRRHGHGANTINCGSSADMYSLGCIITSIYQGGNSPWKMDGDVESFFRHAASHNSQPRLDQVPKELVDHVRLLMHPTPEQRPDAHQLVKISFFDDVGVKTLNYLDSLFQWDNLQKSQRMELLLQKTPSDDVKSDVLPMIYRALEADAAAQIQELCLSVIPSFASLIDYPAMKNALMPRIKKLCQLPGSQLSVRVNCLICIGKLLENVDKWMVLDDILPMLPAIPSKDPAVVMAILGVYKIALEHPRLGIPKEVIATQIIPFLYPMIVEPSLSLSQFRVLSNTIKEMTSRVEEEQRSKLESVAALQEEQRTALGNLSIEPKATGLGSTAASTSSSNAPSVVSEQIDALFAQLSNDGKQITSTPAPIMVSSNSSNRIDMAPVQATSTSAAQPRTSSMMSLRPATSPAPSTWNNSINGLNKDPVSSLMMSNLTNLSGAPVANTGPVTRPNNQWGSVSQPSATSPDEDDNTYGPVNHAKLGAANEAHDGAPSTTTTTALSPVHGSVTSRHPAVRKSRNRRSFRLNDKKNE